MTTIDERVDEFKGDAAYTVGLTRYEFDKTVEIFRRHLIAHENQVRQEEREQMKMRLLMYPLLHPEKLEKIVEYACSFREAKGGDYGER